MSEKTFEEEVKNRMEKFMDDEFNMPPGGYDVEFEYIENKTILTIVYGYDGEDDQELVFLKELQKWFPDYDITSKESGIYYRSMELWYEYNIYKYTEEELLKKIEEHKEYMKILQGKIDNIIDKYPTLYYRELLNKSFRQRLEGVGDALMKRYEGISGVVEERDKKDTARQTFWVTLCSYNYPSREDDLEYDLTLVFPDCEVDLETREPHRSDEDYYTYNIILKEPLSEEKWEIWEDWDSEDENN